MEQCRQLYYAASSFHLLECLTHKLTFHKNSSADIIISKYIPEKIVDVSVLLNYFDNIYICDLQVPCNNEEGYIDRVKEYFQDYLNSNGIELNRYENIYVCAAHYIFGIYLSAMGVKFVFVEDANGMLSRWELLKSIDAPYKIRASVADKLGLYDGTAENIKYCIFNEMCQMPEKLKTDNVLHFNVTEKLSELEEDARKALISIFYKSGLIDSHGRNTILLTQHFCNLKILTFEDQVLIYQTLFDFFIKQEQVIVKPHPDDLMYYGILFPNALVLHEKFPSEFLPFVFTEKANTLATVSSTAIFPLESSYANILKFDSLYEKCFKLTLRTYIALKFIIDAGITTISVCGVAPTMVNNLLKFSDLKKAGHLSVRYLSGQECCNSDDFILLGDDLGEAEVKILSSDFLANNLNFIYIGSKFPFYNFDKRKLLYNCAVIELAKFRKRDDEFYADEKAEQIYLYSHNSHIIRKAEVFYMKKDLNNMGLVAEIVKQDDKDRKIKVLEGILKATEARLEYLINITKEEQNNK